MQLRNIDYFINNFILERTESLFHWDLKNNHEILLDEINNKKLLVIGGAGTIGSNFIRAALSYEPREIVVIDHDENGLTELVRVLRSDSKIKVPSRFFTYPVDYSDPVFSKIFNLYKPFDIVANFAAHKHVRSEKDIFSIEAMFKNNVLNAKHLLDTLVQTPPKHFFCVSTDKAANPVNIMGASKKLMEDLILSYSNDFKVCTARFANVAFSNGSLLFGFVQRIMKQQPLSCPSNIRRYFVSPVEAGQLCLLACVLGNTGNIFFPKLLENKLVNFSEIAIKFLSYLGYNPKVTSSESDAKSAAANLSETVIDYPLYLFDSDTSGEKEFEEFYTGNEVLDLNSFKELGKIIVDDFRDKVEIQNQLHSIQNLFDGSSTKGDLVNRLTELLPGFAHIETGKSLDQKM